MRSAQRFVEEGKEAKQKMRLNASSVRRRLACERSSVFLPLGQMSTKNKQFYQLMLWYKPSSSMRGLLDESKGHLAAVIIAAVFGVVQGGRFFLAAEAASVGILLGGAIAGFTGLYLFGWLLRNFGRWFGAVDPKQRDLRTAIGLSLLPWTLLFAALIPLLSSGEGAEAISGFYPVFFVFLIYGYVILLLSLTAALGISVLKTFLCLVVTFLVSFFPLTLLAQILVGAFGAAS
jgi:hypothetical protein